MKNSVTLKVDASVDGKYIDHLTTSIAMLFSANIEAVKKGNRDNVELTLPSNEVEFIITVLTKVAMNLIDAATNEENELALASIVAQKASLFTVSKHNYAEFKQLMSETIKCTPSKKRK